MKRFVAAALFLASTAALGVNPGSVSIQVVPGRSTCTMAASNATCDVDVDGQAGAGVVIPAAQSLNTNTVITPYFSCDGGTTYSPAMFASDATAGVMIPTLTITTSTAYQYGISYLPCARKVQVKITSGYTSGTASVTVVATQHGESRPPLFGCAGHSIVSTNYTPISITASTQIAAGTSGQSIYICHLDLVAGAADNVALVGGTGSVCATGIAGLAGGTTAATGWNLAANGGLVSGDGRNPIYKSAAAANVCLLVSSGAQLSGTIVWTSL